MLHRTFNRHSIGRRTVEPSIVSCPLGCRVAPVTATPLVVYRQAFPGSPRFTGFGPSKTWVKLKAHINLLVLLMIQVTLDWDRQTVGDWEMRATSRHNGLTSAKA